MLTIAKRYVREPYDLHTYATGGMGFDPLKLYAKLYAVQLTVHLRQGVSGSNRSSCIPSSTLRAKLTRAYTSTLRPHTLVP
jgi:hypothetical protein